jgi:hypothetical protein
VNKTAETQSVATITTPIEEAIIDKSSPIMQQNEVVESGNPVVTQQTVQGSPDSSIVERNASTDTTAKTNSIETVSPIETAAFETGPAVNPVISEPALNHEQIKSDAMGVPINPSVTGPSTNEAVPAESSQQASVNHVPLQSMPATKADYGWLRDVLWSQIERLKGYPYIAR